MRAIPAAPILLAALTLLSAPPAGAATPERAAIPSADGTALDALVFRPDGPGPHPAIILLHGCGGRDDRQGAMMPRDADWASRLAADGYLVVAPDSYGSRGLGQQCTVSNRAVLPGRERRADALGVRAWLAARPDVRAGAIALMGFSNGGSTVVHTADAPGFAAFVALYPGCSPILRKRGWRPASPMLLLIGEADDWTPAAPCAALAAAHPAITYRAYRGAHHGFDAPNSPVRALSGRAFSADGSGRVHAGTDPAAREDALARVPAFLAATLPR
ncbi:dienelactone hydrolase family protein [Elioraea sp.]|uniref:dienelactone hydrolase family protein n=1 Tax=Elioraea sp. TaxID=2185103 RepID=UPI0025BD4D01|nr:dienelactone hydrolase family protein [Elioraea sp.]